MASIALGADEKDNETQRDPMSWLKPVPDNLAKTPMTGILYERWNGVPGAMVRDLLQSPQFKQTATNKGIAMALEFPANDGKDFGVRARGYITPQRSGKVRFFLSSDDNGEFWLSTTGDPFSKKEICWVTGPGWFGSTPRDLTNRISTQLSAPVELEAGKPYYFEGYHKEAAGDDHFEVYWQYEDDKDPVSIPIDVFTPYAGNDADKDDDGLPDKWQTEAGLDGTEARAWWEDADGDTVSNFDEFTGGTPPLDASPLKGAVLLETWYGTVGQDVADLTRDPRFLQPAHRSVFLTAGSATPKSDASFNGTRMSGCIVPKETGDYELSVAGDDGVELWISTDASPLNKQRVAFNDHWRGKEAVDEWTAIASQQAPARRLIAGQPYYFEVLQKDKLAPGWSALGWRLQGEKKYALITPEFLQSPGIDPKDPERRFLPEDWTQQAMSRVAEARRGQADLDLSEHEDPDHDGLENWQEAKLGTDPFNRTSVPGSLIREWWFNVPGVSLLRTRQAGVFLQPPAMRTLTDGSVAEANTTDYFADRLRGILTAPVTGTYRFWISGDDHCELWLSDTADKFHKRKIAWITPETWESPDTDAWTNPEEWDSRPSQQSVDIHMEAGETRFLEILHKEAGDKDHVEIAWQYQRQGAVVWSSRNLVPATAIASYAGDDDDLDDDYLPDSWEIKYGLDPTDNGSKDHDKQGEDGDFDHDGLTNREEYLLGTDPTKADSDGDGVSDYDEVHLYGSDPTKKDASPPVKVGDLSLYTYQAQPGNWAVTPDNTLLDVNRRGVVSFDFDLDANGVYMVELDARISSLGDYALPIPVIASVDGVKVGTGSVLKQGSSLRWLTPWLAAGHHTVTIDNRNVRLGLALEITGLSLFRHEGEDADQNGIPDWMEGLFQHLNGITTTNVDSATSPACVEGLWRFSGDAKLTVTSEGADPADLAAQPGLAGHWFANVPLSSSGDTTLTGSFEQGAVHQQTVCHWVNTNLFDCPDVLQVRVGDSMKFTAIPNGADGSGTHVTYTLGDQPEGEGDATAPTVITFDHAGTWTLTAHTVTGTETLDAAISVQVVGADFGPAFSVASGSPRLWDLPGISKNLTVEADTGLQLAEVERKDGQSREFTATYTSGATGEPVVLARLYPTGPIVAATTVDAFTIVPATESLDARVIGVLPDGTRVVDFALMIDGKIPKDLSIWLSFYVTDALFANGTTSYHLTAADFDKDGIAHLTVYKAPGTGTAWVCHYIKPYSDDVDPDTAAAASSSTGTSGTSGTTTSAH